MSETLPEETRKELFRTLVEVQDQGTPVEKSRGDVASQFDVAINDVREIEQEGITKQWPPL